MTCIYKITSPSNKIYIGQTCHFNNRFAQYKAVSCKNQTKLEKDENKIQNGLQRELLKQL